MRVKVTTRVLRTIDKCGGLDEYLLGEKAARIKELGMLGWLLRWRVMNTDWYKNRRREEIARMNLLPEVASSLLAELDQSRGMHGEMVTTPQLKEQIREVDEQLEEFDEEDPDEKALATADEAKLGPSEHESTAKEMPEKEAEEERILFMAEQPPSPRLRASA